MSKDKGDWEKVHEVALALLLLGGSERKHGRSVSIRWPSFILDVLVEDGFAEDWHASSGFVELSEVGLKRGKELLEKHFGIKLGDGD